MKIRRAHMDVFGRRGHATRRFRTSRPAIALFALATALSFWAFPASAATAPSPDNKQAASDVKNQPAYPAPPEILLPGQSTARVPAALLGLDLVQGKDTLESMPARIDANQPLRVITWWCPRVLIAKPFSVILRFSPANERFTRDVTIQVGPAQGEADWRPGNRYSQETTLDMGSLGSSITGDAVALLLLPSQDLKQKAETPLQSLQVYILPAIGPPEMTRQSLENVLGPRFELIDASFRLGPGAAFHRKLKLSGGTVRLAVVSAFSYGDAPQDTAVARIDIQLRSGKTQSLDLLSGVHTARADYDYAPGKLLHQRVKVVDSTEAAYPDAQGRPFERHKYLGELPLNDKAGDIQAITITNTSDVVLDVYALAFVPADAEPGS